MYSLAGINFISFGRNLLNDQRTYQLLLRKIGQMDKQMKRQPQTAFITLPAEGVIPSFVLTVKRAVKRSESHRTLQSPDTVVLQLYTRCTGLQLVTPAFCHLEFVSRFWKNSHSASYNWLIDIVVLLLLAKTGEKPKTPLNVLVWCLLFFVWFGFRKLNIVLSYRAQSGKL